MRGLGLEFTNPVRTGEVLDVCLCLSCSGVGGVGAQIESLMLYTHIGSLSDLRW